MEPLTTWDYWWLLAISEEQRVYIIQQRGRHRSMHTCSRMFLCIASRAADSGAERAEADWERAWGQARSQNSDQDHFSINQTADQQASLWLLDSVEIFNVLSVYINICAVVVQTKCQNTCKLWSAIQTLRGFNHCSWLSMMLKDSSTWISLDFKSIIPFEIFSNIHMICLWPMGYV